MGPPEGDKLENRKLVIEWAGPYLFEGMVNPSMAKFSCVDKAGQVIRRFQVHGSQVRLCHLGGQPEDDCRQWAVRPGKLPDFPDSEVSGPMYSVDEPQGSQPPKRESVRLIEEFP